MERQRYGGERSRQRWGRKMNNVGETKKDVDELMDRSIRIGKILWQRYAFCDIDRGREIMIYKDLKIGTQIKGEKDVDIKKRQRDGGRVIQTNINLGRQGKIWREIDMYMYTNKWREEHERQRKIKRYMYMVQDRCS